MRVYRARDDTTNKVSFTSSNLLTFSNVIAYVKTRGVTYQHLRYDDTLRCGNAELRVVWPHRVHETYRNSDSLALTLRLLTDAEKSSLPAQTSNANHSPAKTHDTISPSAKTNMAGTQALASRDAHVSTPVHMGKHVSLIAPFLSFEEITDILLERNSYDMELACIAPGVCDDPFTAGELHARVYVLSPPQTPLDSSTNKNSQSQYTPTSYDMQLVREVSVSFTKNSMRVDHAPP